MALGLIANSVGALCFHLVVYIMFTPLHNNLGSALQY
jgi:hypothetical protein